MTTVAIFPQKPAKESQYLKDPKSVLEIDDSEVMKLLHGNRGVFHYSRHDDTLDKLSDTELISNMKNMENYHFFDSDLSQKKTKKGYSTTDKKYFIRIIKA